MKEIPADCSVLVVAGPKNGLPTNEQKMLANARERRQDVPRCSTRRRPFLPELVSPWGVEVATTVINPPPGRWPGQLVESSSSTGSPGSADRSSRWRARSARRDASPDGVTVLSLAKTPSMAWAETKLEGPYQQDADDLPGPISPGGSGSERSR